MGLPGGYAHPPVVDRGICILPWGQRSCVSILRAEDGEPGDEARISSGGYAYFASRPVYASRGVPQAEQPWSLVAV